jgi:hypothetical protein
MDSVIERACPGLHVQTPDVCPFNTAFYASGLQNIGTLGVSGHGQLPVLWRPIPGTRHFDGMGSWPYVWIEGQDDLASLRQDFPDLVTITAVTQPGYVPDSRQVDAVLLKQHYVYDPALPPRPLSARAAGRLRRCAGVADFEVAVDAGRAERMSALYDGLKQRRCLGGLHVDFSLPHFQVIAELESGRYFQVRHGNGTIGAMACAVLFGDMLQILHTASSPDGLRWDASYLLMDGIQRYARRTGTRMFTGGMPMGGSDGLRTFKQRWANSFEPVYMIKLINNHSLYADLCRSTNGDHGFFPAYRRPRQPCQ